MPKRITKLITAPMTKPMMIPIREDFDCLRIALYHPQNAPKIASIETGIKSIQIDNSLSLRVNTDGGKT